MFHMGHIYDHIHFEMNKLYKISIKVRIFFKLLPFTALLVMTNKGSNWISNDSTMLQKTAHVAYGTKFCQKKNHGGHLKDPSCSYYGE